MVLSKEYGKRAEAIGFVQKVMAMLSLIFFGGIIVSELWRTLGKGLRGKLKPLILINP